MNSKLKQKSFEIAVLSFIFIIFLFFIISPVKADVYVGTCEGHVYNTEGQLVSSARVVARVDRCIIACSRETSTDANGYYVVANLNLPKLETLTVYAEKMTALGLEFGSNQGTANEYQAALVDVVICLPPPKPDLVDEPNTHNTSVTLEWTSYADKKGYSVYDEFRIDSGAAKRITNFGTRSQDVTNLAFSSHNWQVRTCNPFCCSEWVTDYFNVGNLPPSPPNLTDQLDTVPGKVSLSWQSGIDPDGDETYDEYKFGIIDTSTTKTIIEATSPQEEDVVGCNYYRWQVRTCEKESQHLCSYWSQDGFIACGLECPSCSGNVGECNCGQIAKQPYSLALSAPSTIKSEDNLTMKVTFGAYTSLENLIFKVNSSEFIFNDFRIAKIDSKKAEFVMVGRQRDNLMPGTYNLILDVYVSNFRAFSEKFSVKVEGALLINIKRLVREIPKRGNWIWLIIAILIIVSACIAGILIYKYKKKKDLEKLGNRKQSVLQKPRTQNLQPNRNTL